MTKNVKIMRRKRLNFEIKCQNSVIEKSVFLGKSQFLYKKSRKMSLKGKNMIFKVETMRKKCYNLISISIFTKNKKSEK